MRGFTWTKRIAAGLALGAVVTTGVAWLIALTAPTAGGVQTRDITVKTATPGEYIRLVDERRAFGAYTRRAWVVAPMDDAAQRIVDERLVASGPWWLPADLRFTNMFEEHSGWPLPALRAGWRGGSNGEWAFGEFTWNGVERKLPIVPLTSGFLFDTALFGGAYVGAAALRARWARRRADEPERASGVWVSGNRVAAGVLLGIVVTVATAWTISILGVSNGVGVGSFGGFAPAAAMGPVTTFSTSGPIRVTSAGQLLTLGIQPAAVARLSVTTAAYADAATQCEYDAAEARGFGWHFVDASCLPAAGVDPNRSRAPRWMVSAIPVDTQWSGVFYGWPLKTLSIGGPVTSRFGEPTKAELLVRTSGAAYPLPVIPVWRGFAASVAAVCVAYVAIALHFARRREVRAGRCRKCLYDLRGLPDGAPCPECGTPSKAPTATPPVPAGAGATA